MHDLTFILEGPMMPSSPSFRLASALSAALVLLFLTASTPPKSTSSLSSNKLEAALDKLGAHQCKDSKLTCVTLTMPLDQLGNDPKGHVDIDFAVHFSEKPSKGLLIYLVGGPGSSGLEAAEDSLSDHNSRLGQEMDIVFLDQRGTGDRNAMDCPKASAVYDMATIDLDKPDEAVDLTKTFVAGCIKEMKHTELLPYLGTDQAIRDLETFRQAIGAPKVWLYGESYGTQFAQQYAVAFPDAIAGVILDGVIDTNLDAEGYAAEDGRAAESILARLFAACDDKSNCHADMSAPAATVYDALAARLAKAPIAVDYPLPDGSARRQLTRGMLEGAAFSALYGPGDRRDFIRALAAAGHEDLVPLLRLAYYNLALDPLTLEALGYSGFYLGAYYGISCQDYAEPGADPTALAKSILAEAKTRSTAFPHFPQLYVSDRLPCAFWPAKGKVGRPKAFTGGSYPTVILNSDADPATPISNGYAVFDRVKNGYMITMQGGPHVIMGRDDACPDKVVLGLMLDDQIPIAHEQICDTALTRSYVPLTLTDPADAKDPLKVARGVEVELERFPEFYWDLGSDPVSIGCDHGGKIEARETKTGREYRFRNCGLWPELRISGTASAHQEGDNSDDITLAIDVAGAHQGHLNYHHDWITEATSLGGEYDGKDLATPRPPLR
ncbi:alpha/beta fold hydrolase [Hypericibacter terrae]|nr:alpha/beta fold hydrolase [Hypericibacter terrae]